MGIFHKDILTEISKHLETLERFGLVPEAWIWKSKKVRILDEITEKLIEDLRKLHILHSEIEDNYKYIFPLLKELHTDLTTILTQNSPLPREQKRAGEKVNKLLNNIHQTMQIIVQHQEWEEERKKIKILLGIVYERINSDSEFAKKYSKEHQEFVYILNGLPKQFGRKEDYAAFHDFVGGSTNYGISPKVDMPGKFSIESFYRRCLAEDFPLQEFREIA